MFDINDISKIFSLSEEDINIYALNLKDDEKNNFIKKITLYGNENKIDNKKIFKIVNIIRNPKILTKKRKEIKKTCEHYPNKKCYNLYFECCNTYDTCVRCHINNNNCSLNPPKVTSIVCSECNTTQKPSKKCINEKCSLEKFSYSYCDICKIWSDFDIFHCDKCFCCRVGKKEEIKHCDTCKTCMGIDHVCIYTSIDYSQAKCCICLESIFNSQKTSIALNCSHIVHNSCINNSISNSNGDWTKWRCGFCRKIFIDKKHLEQVWNLIKMTIKIQKMPPLTKIFKNEIYMSPYGKFKYDGEDLQLENINNVMFSGKLIDWNLNNKKNPIIIIKKSDLSILALISCIECGKKNMTVKFHFVGNQCLNCYSFNTVVDYKSKFC